MTIRVDLGGLDPAGRGLGGLAVGFRSIGERLAGIDGLHDPSVRGGIDQFVTAYTVVVTLVADDVALVARRIAEAGVAYRLTESAEAAGAAGPS